MHTVVNDTHVLSYPFSQQEQLRRLISSISLVFSATWPGIPLNFLLQSITMSHSTGRRYKSKTKPIEGALAHA